MTQYDILQDLAALADKVKNFFRKVLLFIKTIIDKIKWLIDKIIQLWELFWLNLYRIIVFLGELFSPIINFFKAIINGIIYIFVFFIKNWYTIVGGISVCVVIILGIKIYIKNRAKIKRFIYSKKERVVIYKDKREVECPYCLANIKEGEQVIKCGSCGVYHHLECWQEDNGCAVFFCNRGYILEDAKDRS